MRLTFTDPGSCPTRSTLSLLIPAGLWMALIGNLPLWMGLWDLPEISGWRGMAFTAAYALMIASLVIAFLSLLAWRWTLKPAITTLLLLSAIATHYMWQYGIVIDTSMLVNVLQTDVRETRDQLSWGLLWPMLGVGILPGLWVWRQRWEPRPWGQQLGHNALTLVVSLIAAVGILMVMFQDFSSLMRNHTRMRYQMNPLNSIYAVLDLTLIQKRSETGPLQPIGKDARITRTPPRDRPPLLILVLGETARSANFSLNGYERQTNPLLAKENVTSFLNVTSCGTSTAASVPCMFSRLGRDGFASRAHDEENFLDVLQHAGYAVLWIDNQSGCKDQCDRIPNINTSTLKLPEFCQGDECLDTVMLRQLDAELAKLPSERRAKGTVVVLHQMGSHGPAYHKRSPAAFKHFMPECTETSLAQCSQQEVVNAYDNTLVFTDHFLARTIAWLKAQQAHATPAMLYVSDHGESLGENNLYLHGLPYTMAPAAQKNVPMISWLSPGFERWSQVSTACLKGMRDRPLSHDNLFHAVLGLMAVDTSVYVREQDFFAACAGR